MDSGSLGSGETERGTDMVQSLPGATANGVPRSGVGRNSGQTQRLTARSRSNTGVLFLYDMTVVNTYGCLPK